jgi:hypothetical protein
MSYLIRALAFAALAFGVIQLFPVDLSGPPDSGPLVIEDPAIAAIVDRACSDCHTNQTDWPWYAHIAPASWLTARHVREGREELNFSTWGELAVRRQFSKLGEVIEYVENGEMPLPSYTWAHPEARLGEADRQALIDWATELRNELRSAERTQRGEGEEDRTRPPDP